jgi:hypothetical protein
VRNPSPSPALSQTAQLLLGPSPAPRKLPDVLVPQVQLQRTQLATQITSILF